VDGHRVKVISENDALNPGTSLAEVERMVSQDHVVGIIDDSDEDSAWSTYVEQHHVPVLGGNLSNATFFTNPDFFPEGTTQNYLANQIVAEAKKAGAKNLAVLYCAEVVACQEAVPPIKSIGQKDRVPLVYSTAISSSAPNYAAQCLAAKDAGAQSINIAAAATVVTSVASSCAAQGYTPIQLAIGGSVALSWAKATGMDNTIATENDVPFFVRSTPATREMEAALKKYQPSVAASPNYGEAVTNSWVSGLLIEAVATAAHVKATTKVTSATLFDGLYRLHGATLDGMAPPLTFRPGKANSVNCFFYMRIQHGKFTTPYGLKPSCIG
jgi:branched-chain amino acid transport system substrate-binding protein